MSGRALSRRTPLASEETRALLRARYSDEGGAAAPRLPRPRLPMEPVTEAVRLVLTGKSTVAQASAITRIDPEAIEMLARAKVERQVRRRDAGSCLACRARGTDVVHRVRRGVGYNADPVLAFGLANAVLLCAVHCARAEDLADPEMEAKGYRLRLWQKPEEEPVTMFSESHSGITVWLTASGEFSTVPPERAA